LGAGVTDDRHAQVGMLPLAKSAELAIHNKCKYPAVREQPVKPGDLQQIGC